MKKRILKRNKINIFCIFLICVMLSCSSKNEKKYSDVIFELNQLKKKAKNGDTLAYNKLYNYFEYDNTLDELLAISIIISNKYNYAKAQFDVYAILLDSLYDARTEKYNWDKISLNICFDYLKRAVLAKNSDALNNLKFHIDNYDDELSIKIKNDKDLRKIVDK